jgi:hypothetical protein
MPHTHSQALQPRYARNHHLHAGVGASEVVLPTYTPLAQDHLHSIAAVLQL